MLSNSWPRGTHEIRKVIVADCDSEQRAAGFFDAEIGTQFQKRQSDAFMKTEA